MSKLSKIIEAINTTLVVENKQSMSILKNKIEAILDDDSSIKKTDKKGFMYRKNDIDYTQYSH